MYRMVIFDLDGTLLNTLRDLAEAGNYTLRKLNYPTHDIDEYRYYIGNGIPKLVERMLPSDSSPEQKEAALGVFRQYYNEHMEDYTEPYGGITEMLRQLKENGIKTAVVTNKAHEFAETIIRKYFDNKIDNVYGNSAPHPQKPDPYWVNRAVENADIDKADVLYVGDSGVDMITAINADIDSCGVLWGYRDEVELRENGAKYICSEINQLINLILN